MIYQFFSKKSSFFTALILVFFMALSSTLSAQAEVELDDSGTRIANPQTQVDAKGIMEIQTVNQWLPAGVVKVIKRVFPRAFQARKVSAHIKNSATRSQAIIPSSRRKLPQPGK